MNLATEDKVSNKDLAHNLSINTYRCDLGLKVAIGSLAKNRELILQNHKLLKDQKIQFEELQRLSKVVRLQRTDLKKSLEQLDVLTNELRALRTNYLGQKPLTKTDVETLVLRISEQPKFIEKQTEALTEELTKEVKTLKEIINSFEKKILS